MITSIIWWPVFGSLKLVVNKSIAHDPGWDAYALFSVCELIDPLAARRYAAQFEGIGKV